MAGRHRRNGPVPEPYVPVWLDAWEHEVAALLTAAWPGWLVLWGTYWRCWSAFAMFTTDPVVVNAGTKHALEVRMREVAMAVRTHRW